MLVGKIQRLLQKALSYPSPDWAFFDTLPHEVAVRIDLIAEWTCGVGEGSSVESVEPLTARQFGMECAPEYSMCMVGP